MKPAAAVPPSYKRDVIERFLCAYHGVTSLADMTPFGKRVDCWRVMAPVTLAVETKVPTGQVFHLKQPAESNAVSIRLGDTVNAKRLDSHLPPPALAFKHPQTKQPIEVDLDHVYPFSIITRHVRSNVPIPVAVRLNFYHQSLNTLEKQEEHDDLLAIGGAIKGAYTSVSATPAYGEDVEVAGLKRRQFSYCNEFFVSTMALVNEDNLNHGIIKIPPETCKEAGLLLFQGVPEPPKDWQDAELAEGLGAMDISEDDRSASFKAKWTAEAEKRKMFPISHYYAVPINHVLAWGLHSKEYAASHKVSREEFYFTPPLPKDKPLPKGPLGAGEILLYYLVSDVSMKAMREDFQKHWMGKADCRPLNSMGVDMIPMTGARRYPGLPPDTEQVKVDTLMVRSTFAYMVAPKLSREQIANLAPTLCPTFPSCRDWDPKQAARQRELEQYLK